MGDDHINDTSRYDHINNTSQYYDYYRGPFFIRHVATYIIISIGLPLTLVAIYALHSLVRKDNVAPIYVINLLISDIIQFCCMIVYVAKPGYHIYLISDLIYFCSLMVSVGFMVCIALERYLVIACPLWYRFRRSIKISIVVCVLVWIFSPIYCFCFLFINFSDISLTITTIFVLLPLPLLIFFLVGTLKALSASISVPADEKRRIVAMLVMVLLIYTLLFLPGPILFLKEGNRFNFLRVLFNVFLRLSPLADLVLYVFMRKGVIDKFLAPVCCCIMDSNDDSSLTV
ncbi:G-protein coupled receptor 4-like [Sander lucioperca]|uniref:G-protein coupled receptor 4-like n=1 Tax=Sander lucioperca TaxID=283035 RepID=UPI00125DDDD4|nr:G-protein coupled receptor 4-like [Sander lucioperca]